MDDLSRRLGASWVEVGLVLVAALGIYLAAVLYTRVAGQRSLSRVSTFDFVVTVAVGALVGRVVLVRTTLLAGIIGLGMLFLLQAVIRFLRNHTSWARVVENEAVLLFRDGRVLADNLGRAHMSEDDVLEEIRLSGATRLASVRAVVLERSGQVSVVVADEAETLDERLFEKVRGWT